MLTGGKILSACIALAMLSAQARAQSIAPQPAVWQPSMDGQANNDVLLVNRRVPVWRGSAAANSGPNSMVGLDSANDQEPIPPGVMSGSQNSGSSNDDGCCDACGCNTCCCEHFWEHHSGFYAEYLWLHATGVDMAHAIQQNGVGGQGTVPAGRVGVVDPIYEPGFRLGFDRALDCCTSLSVGYTQYRSHASDRLILPDGLGGTVSSLVFHPQTVNAGSTSTLVDATYDIDFQFVDLELNRLLCGSERSVVNYTVGLRYGNLQQNFLQFGSFAPPLGDIETRTDIDFDGLGLRVGLDGQRKIGCRGLSLYSKGFINMLFGEFNTEFVQTNVTTNVIQATSNWADERVVPVLEYELGTKWTSCNGRLSISSGYYTAFWFNTISTAKYVQAVQNANFTHVADTIAFDGFTTRVELRF